MTKIMKVDHTQDWSKIEVLTGVARPTGSSVDGVYERGFDLIQYWTVLENINTSHLQPRLKQRYRQIACLMHYMRKDVGEVLTMRVQDLEGLITNLSKKKTKGKIASAHAVEELTTLFKRSNGEDGFNLLFHAPNKMHVPLSKAKVMELFLKLTVGLDEVNELSWEDAVA